MREEEKEIREALKKDFQRLYVKEFTTSWKTERVIRNAEIQIMELENTAKRVARRPSVEWTY